MLVGDYRFRVCPSQARVAEGVQVNELSREHIPLNQGGGFLCRRSFAEQGLDNFGNRQTLESARHGCKPVLMLQELKL